MSHNYNTEKEKLFTDEGQRLFLKVRDKVMSLLEAAGAFQMEKILSMRGIPSDTWLCLTCVDRMVELGEIIEIDKYGSKCGQHRVFIRS